MYKDLTQTTAEELRSYFQDRDYMVIAVPKNELIRVYTLRASMVVKTAQRIHGLEGKSLELMAYTLMSALLLTSLVKHATPQKVLFKLSTDGGSAVAEADGMGRVRGFIEGDPLCCWESGTLTVVKELRLGVPYTSIVPIVGVNIREVLSFYFEQSEQTKTYIDLYYKEGEALAYLVQVLSSASESAVRKIEENLRSLSFYGKRPEDLALHILEGLEPRLIGLKEVEYYCPCTEEIAKASLSLLSEEELEEILNEGPAEVVCRFCGRVYRFDRGQLML